MDANRSSSPQRICGGGCSTQQMTVKIPTPLLSYTNQRKQVEAAGATLAELLEDLNHQFPGIRFRMVNEQGDIRPHMRVFVNANATKELNTPLHPSDQVHIIQALSGG